MPRSAVALRHLHFEDLGSFDTVLREAGYEVRHHDVGTAPMEASDAIETDLIVVLGGPIGVYEVDRYPFLSEERAFLRARLAANRPTLGICLGAQLIAAALGATVAPAGRKEIGFAPLSLTAAGMAGPLRHLAEVPVLHWHGDMFEVPAQGERLAETEACANQAFAIGPNILGVQFHPEVDTTSGIERWLIGHAVELAAAGVDPQGLRGDAEKFGECLRDAGRAMLRDWLGGLQC